MNELSSSGGNASLIAGLSESLSPVRRRRSGREALILVGILALQLLGTMALLGANSAAVFTHNPSQLIAKSLMLGGLTLGFAMIAFRSFEPTAPRQNNLALAIGGLLLGFGILSLDRSFGGGAMNILMPSKGITCLISSVSFALPMFIGLTIFMRGAAPTQPLMTALFIGIASGSWGVFVYGLQCPFMNVAYIAVWYGGAVALTTLAAAVILPRLNRW
ncbi:MAG: NrsF family protein [Pseudomonadota bacterium]